jgi:hypothetical protein
MLLELAVGAAYGAEFAYVSGHNLIKVSIYGTN